MKKLLSILSATLLGAVVSLIAVGPAAATSNGGVSNVTASGNVISWTGASVPFDTGTSVGHYFLICDGDLPACQSGGAGFISQFWPNDPVTSSTVTSTALLRNGEELGAGEYTVQMMYGTGKDGNGDGIAVTVGPVLKLDVPLFVPQSPAPPQSSGQAPAPAPAPFDPATAPPPAAGLALQASVGSRVENSPVSFTGTTMKSGASYILTVNSDPIVLAQGIIAENGRINGLPRLPALPPGTHTLRLTTTGWDGSRVTISQVFVVGEDGRFVSISEPAGAVTPVSSKPDTLAYTGLQSSTLPWWALVLLSLGLALLVYSARAQAMMSSPEFRKVLLDARGPWEILATPIRVPGIDYTPDASASVSSSPSLGEAIRELDLAFSKMIALQLGKVALPASKA